MAQQDPGDDRALVALTLDLEMSRNFPSWDQTHWDYQKGNLDTPTKRYTVEACRLARAAGGRMHLFAVGQVFEQDSVEWLRGLARDGHPIGNHTYDHVNILARAPADLQFRFRRWPWLLCGRTVERVIVDQIRMTDEAIAARLETKTRGFRSPGGFAAGLAERPDVQKLLQGLGFTWVSTQYVGVREVEEGTSPTPRVYEGVVRSQALGQPHVYRSGLVEIPMSTVSDIHAFRTGRWRLAEYLRALEVALDWTIKNRAVFDWLAHPSCLVAMDPDFQAVRLLCERVRASAGRAALVDLDVIARRALRRNR
jgi:hypothetical protein